MLNAIDQLLYHKNSVYFCPQLESQKFTTGASKIYYTTLEKNSSYATSG